MKRLILLAGAVGIVALPAVAQRNGDSNKVWDFLLERYDADKDGKISSDEYKRGDDKFKKFDRDGDGTLTAADFARSGRQRGRGRGRGGNRNRGRGGRNLGAMIAASIARRADGDKDEKVTLAEWNKHVKGCDADQDGVLGGAEFTEIVKGVMGGRRNRGGRNTSDRMTQMVSRSLDKNEDGDVQVSEVSGLFATIDADKNQVLTGQELGNRQRGNRQRGGRGRGAAIPKVGEVAPDFDLPFVKDAKKTVRLSSFKGQKPVALIFGSYT